jgi:hypothetical protein
MQHRMVGRVVKPNVVKMRMHLIMKVVAEIQVVLILRLLHLETRDDLVLVVS